MDLIPGTRRIETIKYVLAADLGQSSDPTAIAVIEHRSAHREHVKGGIDQREETLTFATWRGCR